MFFNSIPKTFLITDEIRAMEIKKKEESIQKELEKEEIARNIASQVDKGVPFTIFYLASDTGWDEDHQTAKVLYFYHL